MAIWEYTLSLNMWGRHKLCTLNKNTYRWDENDSYLSPKSIWTRKFLTWNWFTGFSQHLEGRKTHEHDVVRERKSDTRVKSCWPVWGSWHTAGQSYWTPWRPGKTESTRHRASFSCGPALSPQKPELLQTQQRESRITCKWNSNTHTGKKSGAIMWHNPFIT